MVESFFSTLECDLLARRRFRSQAEARMACFSYIEGLYNPLRRHSPLGYRSPVVHEQETRPEPSTEPLPSQAPYPSTKPGQAQLGTGDGIGPSSAA